MPEIVRHHYVLAVHDVRRSAEWYMNMLGFEIMMEPEGWIFVGNKDFMIMLGECPDDMPANELGCHNYFAYLRVDDADSFYNDMKAKGADIISEIEDKSWEMREFGVRTSDGHRIMIGQWLGE